MASSHALRRLACAALVAALVSASVACGPVTYLGAVTREATRAVAEAGARGAATSAPYEWAAALLYLDKARELAGYGRWQDALVCGRRAAVLARASVEHAAPREAR